MALLEVQGIVKRFGGLVAVNDFSLSLERGDIVALDDNTCAVVDLSGEFAIGLSPDGGLARVPLSTALYAWSVG